MFSNYKSSTNYLQFLTVLSRGGVCVFPTDTVVGIGCLAYCGFGHVESDAGREKGEAGSRAAILEGVSRIYEIKRRSFEHKLPWLVRDFYDVEKFACGDLSLARDVADECWPGDTTIVVPVSWQVADEFCVKRKGVNTLAVRCPDVKFLLSAMEELDSPIVCTSANLTGEAAVASIDDVSTSVLEQVDFVYKGEGCLPAHTANATGSPSKIFDCCGDKLVQLR